MLLMGLQKLTLLDFPEKTACTVFTGGCNMRCPFCHNASLVTGDIKNLPHLPEREFFEFLKKRQGILEGVCVTGGEPTLQPDLIDFLLKIKGMGFAVKLDTNGTRSDVIKEAVQKGAVDYVAMDIKNSKDLYPVTVGDENFDITPICSSVELLKSDIVDYEFRTTLVKPLHNEQSVKQIGQWISGAKRYFLQNFVDSGDLISNSVQFGHFEQNEIENLLNVLKPLVPSTKSRGI